MRKPEGMVGIETDPVEQLVHPIIRLRSLGDVVHDERLAEGRADRLARVQRAVGILKDHLQAAAHPA